MKRLTALATLTIGFVAGSAHAAGLAVDTQSARATGMATAVTAIVDDSSSIFYNPAGMAQGKGIDAQAGDTLIMPSITYKGAQGSWTTPFSVVPPLNAYISGGITDHLSAGIGMYTPYGLTIGWPTSWAGRSQIMTAALTTYYFNPSMAYQFGPLRVGAGVDLAYSTVDLKRDIALPNGAFGSTEVGGETWGLGANVGVQVEAIEHVLSFGLHYRSAVALPFNDLSAHFNGIPPSLSGTLHDQPAATRFVMPDSLAFGVAVRPIKKLVLGLDVIYYGWQHLDAVNVTFPNDATGTLGSSSSERKAWSAIANVHLGGEYAFDDTWRGRLGVMFDPSPSPQDTMLPDLPDMWRMNFAVGAGYRHKSGIYLDLAYQFVMLFPRSSSAPQLPGDYSGFANLLALSIGFNHKAPSQTSVQPTNEPPRPPPPLVEPPVEPPPATPPPGD